MGKAGGVAFGEAIFAKALIWLKQRSAKSRSKPRSTMREIIFSSSRPMVPRRRKVAMARRSSLSSPGVKSAATIANFMACS